MTNITYKRPSPAGRGESKPANPWTQEAKDKLVEMFDLGFHYSEIAEAVGRTHAAVQRQISFLKVAMKKQNAQLL
jgi:hypothetical protein